MKQLALISGTANRPLADGIERELNSLIPDRVIKKHKTAIMRFLDGEIYCNISGGSVRGSEVFIVQPTCNPANENLMELLLLVDAARRASAGSITAVIPYFGYARQDRKVERRDPISARLVANMLEAAGVNHVLTMDLHAKQIQGFFNIPVDNLSSASYFATFLKEYYDPENTVIVSPDVGGMVRARKFAEKMGVSDKIAIVNKVRAKANMCDVMNIIGEVEGKDCIIFDDMIDTAGTLCKAADALLASRAKSVAACASHGVLSGQAEDRIANSGITAVHLLDTIPNKTFNSANGKIIRHGSSGMFAEAIHGIFFDTSFEEGSDLIRDI